MEEDYKRQLARLQKEKPQSHMADEFLVNVVKMIKDSQQEELGKFECCGAPLQKEQYIVNTCCLTQQCYKCVFNHEFQCITCNKHSNLAQAGKQPALLDTLYCLICYEPLASSEMSEEEEPEQIPIYLKRCKHLFCRYCLKEYVSENIH